MSADEAIERLKALNAEARAGWPKGYRPGEVRSLAFEAIDVLAGAVDAAPEERQRALARTFVRRLAAFEATVRPKGRKILDPGSSSPHT